MILGVDGAQLSSSHSRTTYRSDGGGWLGPQLAETSARGLSFLIEQQMASPAPISCSSLLSHVFRPSSDATASVKPFRFCADGQEPFLPQITEVLYFHGSNGTEYHNGLLLSNYQVLQAILNTQHDLLKLTFTMTL